MEESDFGGKIRVLFVPAEGIAERDLFTLNTMARLEEALFLWRTGEFDLMVLSGGEFLPRNIQTRPAAVLMGKWIVSQWMGPKKDQVIMETESLDTYENVIFAVRKILRREIALSRVELTVCTEYFHAQRIATTFRCCYSLNVAIHAVKQPDMGFVAYLKEFFLNLLHWWDPEGVSFIPRKNREARREAAARWEG